MSDLGNKEVFSNNLKKYMEIMNVTRAEMVDKMGVAYSTFNDWYNAETYPRIDKIEWLANFFGIPKSKLIEENSEEEFDYYLDPETRQIAEEISRREDLKILMNSTRKMSPEDIKAVNLIVETLRRKEQPEDD